MGLNDMNGRVQDAVTGRFLSVDPFISEPGFTRGYNRYSYVDNNPLSATDPSGFQLSKKYPKLEQLETQSELSERGSLQFQNTYNNGYGPDGVPVDQGMSAGAQLLAGFSEDGLGAHSGYWLDYHSTVGTTEVGPDGVPVVPVTGRQSVWVPGSLPNLSAFASALGPLSRAPPEHEAALEGSFIGLDGLLGVASSAAMTKSGCVSQDCQLAATLAIGWVAPEAVRGAAGLLKGPAAGTVQAWSGTITAGAVPEGGMTAFRVWGGESSQVGSWLTPIAPASSSAARSLLSLPRGNTADFLSTVQTPAGTQIQFGRAASAFGQSGGGIQIQLLERIPGSSFGPGVPLGP